MAVDHNKLRAETSASLPPPFSALLWRISLRTVSLSEACSPVIVQREHGYDTCAHIVLHIPEFLQPGGWWRRLEKLCAWRLIITEDKRPLRSTAKWCVRETPLQPELFGCMFHSCPFLSPCKAFVKKKTKQNKTLSGLKVVNNNKNEKTQKGICCPRSTRAT